MSRALALLNATIVYRQPEGAAALLAGVGTSSPATASRTTIAAARTVRLEGVTDAESTTNGARCATFTRKVVGSGRTDRQGESVRPVTITGFDESPYP